MFSNKVILSFWVCVARQLKVPKIRSLNNLVDEVKVWPTDKRESFLQVDSITFGVCS